jgi:hypothetical protein
LTLKYGEKLIFWEIDMPKAGGAKKPCYTDATHPDVYKDIASLASNGQVAAIGNVLALLEYAIEECVSPSDPDDYAGTELLYVRSFLPIAGVFTVNFTRMHLIILAIANGNARAVSLAKLRI